MKSDLELIPSTPPHDDYRDFENVINPIHALYSMSGTDFSVIGDRRYFLPEHAGDFFRFSGSRILAFSEESR